MSTSTHTLPPLTRRRQADAPSPSLEDCTDEAVDLLAGALERIGQSQKAAEFRAHMKGESFRVDTCEHDHYLYVPMCDNVALCPF